MRNGISIALLCLLLSACSTGGQGGGLYVYLDEQGNLVTGEIPAEPVAQEPVPHTEEAAAATAAMDAEVLAYQMDEAGDQEPVEPAPPRDREEVPEQEQERFVTYIDGDGQVTRQRVDLAAERRANEARAPAYEPIEPAQEGAYLETVTPVEAGCCLALLEEAQALRPGKERLLQYTAGQSARIYLGGSWLPARVLALSDELSGVRVLSFKQHGRYLHPQLLLLDEQGQPLLQVDNVFTRRFPESWLRYAYIEGTLPREPGQRYLVVYLGYAEGGMPGLVGEPDSELAIEGSVVVRGY